MLASGAARPVFDAMVAAQGGDLGGGLPQAAHRDEVVAPRSGWLSRLDCRAVGIAAWRLGAGRARKEDAVSAVAGVRCHKKPGERVEEGEPVLEFLADEPDRFHRAREAVAEAIEIDATEPETASLVVERIA